MKITIRKKESVKRSTNRWLIFSILIFALVIAVVFAGVRLLALQNQANSVAALNSACIAYGNSLTQEFKANSSVIQSSLNVSGINYTRGDSFYCYYSYSCASAKPYISNSLSCLCDILQSSRVILSGECMKQILSNG
ncbi:MAG: hypothetical protein QXK90_04145 [Candidatus Parvarchaeota archaeon]